VLLICDSARRSHLQGCEQGFQGSYYSRGFTKGYRSLLSIADLAR
jgi:hypothetical protein